MPGCSTSLSMLRWRVWWRGSAECMPGAASWVKVDLGVDEPGSGQSVEVLRPGQRTGDAPDVGAALGPVGRGEVVLGDDVGDPDPPARAQHPEHLGQHGRLVGRQVDHAVGDDDVDRRRPAAAPPRWCPCRNSTLVAPALAAFARASVEHLVGHVDAVGESGRADPARRQQHVDAAARAQVEHPLARAQLGDRDRVPAAQAGRRPPRAGSSLLLVGAVQRRPERGVDLAAATATAASLAAGRSNAAGVHHRQRVAPRSRHRDRRRGVARPEPARAARRSVVVIVTSSSIDVRRCIDDARRIDVCQCVWQTGCMPSRPLLPLLPDDLAACCSPLTGSVLDAGAAEQLAHVFKALGDPTRVRLLSLIAATDGGEACICDLTAPVGLSQPTVSHHMKLLVDAGLVTREQRGKWAYYALVPGALAELGAALRDA